MTEKLNHGTLRASVVFDVITAPDQTEEVQQRIVDALRELGGAMVQASFVYEEPAAQQEGGVEDARDESELGEAPYSLDTKIADIISLVVDRKDYAVRHGRAMERENLSTIRSVMVMGKQRIMASVGHIGETMTNNIASAIEAAVGYPLLDCPEPEDVALFCETINDITAQVLGAPGKNWTIGNIISMPHDQLRTIIVEHYRCYPEIQPSPYISNPELFRQLAREYSDRFQSARKQII